MKVRSRLIDGVIFLGGGEATEGALSYLLFMLIEAKGGQSQLNGDRNEILDV